MQDLIGKKYQYRLIPDEKKTITTVQNETVIFNDGGRVPLNRLNELFLELPDENAMDLTEARKMLTQNVEEIDTVNFFNTAHHNALLSQLKKQAETIDTSKLQQPTLATNTTITDNVQSGPVKKIIVETDEKTGKTFSHEETAPPTSSDFFKKMKRSTEVTINVKIVERIPNLDFIKMMDENFDQGVLEYLIENITETFISSPNIIQAQVREQLNAMVYKKTSKDKPKKEKKKNVVAKNTQANQ